MDDNTHLGEWNSAKHSMACSGPTPCSTLKQFFDASFDYDHHDRVNTCFSGIYGIQNQCQKMADPTYNDYEFQLRHLQSILSQFRNSILNFRVVFMLDPRLFSTRISKIK